MPVNVGPGVGEYNVTVDHIMDGEEASEVNLKRATVNLENRTDALKDFAESEEARLDTVSAVAYAQSNRIAAMEPLVAEHQEILEVIEPLALTALQPFPVIIATADFTAETDKIYVLDPALTSMSVQLPPPAMSTVITLKELAVTNVGATITVLRDGTELIDGEAEDYEFAVSKEAVTFVSDGVDWFLTSTGGGSGTGDTFRVLERMLDRLDASTYEYLGPVIFAESEEELVNVGNTTALLSPADGNSYKFLNIGDVVETISLVSESFLIGVNALPEDEPTPITDIGKVETLFYFDLEAVDTDPTFEISRDGSEFQEITADRLGDSDLYRGVHTFADEAANAYTQVIGGATTGTLDLDDTNELYRSFVLAEATTLKDIKTLGLTVTGAPIGYLDVLVIRDDGGAPSTDPEDLMSSTRFDISTLVTGNVEPSITAPCEADTYHVVLRTSDAYKTEYTNSVGANKISFNEDGSGITFGIEGRELQLILKVTGGTVDALLKAVGVMYSPLTASNRSVGDYQVHKVAFDGLVDNEYQFTLPFLPNNPDLLLVADTAAGQTWMRGADSFTTSGSVVTFEENFFNREGIVNLTFMQLSGSTVDDSNRVMAILAANHLGTDDPNTDLSVAGRGILLAQENNGIKKEVALDELGFIKIS